MWNYILGNTKTWEVGAVIRQRIFLLADLVCTTTLNGMAPETALPGESTFQLLI